MLQANRKWNQGYMMPREPQAINSLVHCVDCVHILPTPNQKYKYRCGFDKGENKFEVAAAGSCRYAELPVEE
jgi:hypothetical protein